MKEDDIVMFTEHECLLLKKGLEIIQKEIYADINSSVYNGTKPICSKEFLDEAFSDILIKLNALRCNYNLRYKYLNHTPRGGINTAVIYGKKYINYKLKNKF
jgi:hypothetical protein